VSRVEQAAIVVLAVATWPLLYVAGAIAHVTCRERLLR
jgi:hypothetical protein